MDGRASGLVTIHGNIMNISRSLRAVVAEIAVGMEMDLIKQINHMHDNYPDHNAAPDNRCRKPGYR